MGEPLPIRLFETLTNLLGMYTYPDEEVLILEAVANGIDAKANKINITFEKSKNQHYILFHNNGTPMTEKDFVNYHTISLSSKTKGNSIGFAGVGAKIFLASQKGHEIITISGKGSKVFASRMYREKEDVQYETSLKMPISKILKNYKNDHIFGTTYKVSINEDAYNYLKEKIVSIIQFWFNYSLMSKSLEIQVNKKSISAWTPKGKKIKKQIQFKKNKIVCYFWITETEISEYHKHITYSVYGKRIRTDTVDFSHQIKGDVNSRVFCIADVTFLSGYLNSNKEDFQKNPFTNGVSSEIKKNFFEFLKDQKLLVDPDSDKEVNKIVVNELTKKLESILQNKEFKFLNPFANPRSHLVSLKNEGGKETLELTDGTQTINGDDGDGQNGNGVSVSGDSDGLGYTRSEDGKELGNTKEQKSKGLFIMYANFPDDPREAWVDPENKGLVYNSGHSFNKKFEKSSLFNYNLIRVCISSLIKYRNGQVEWDSNTTLEYFEKILHRVWEN